MTITLSTAGIAAAPLLPFFLFTGISSKTAAADIHEANSEPPKDYKHTILIQFNAISKII